MVHTASFRNYGQIFFENVISMEEIPLNWQQRIKHNVTMVENKSSGSIFVHGEYITYDEGTCIIMIKYHYVDIQLMRKYEEIYLF